MSPTLSVKQHRAKQQSDTADLQSLDLLFAVSLHVLVIAGLLILSLWHKPQEFHPQVVQVTTITAKQLDQMVRRARPPERAPEPRHKPKPKPRIEKPVVKAEPKPTPPKPHPKPEPKRAAKAKAEDRNFDPFKPIESSSDVKSTSPKPDDRAAEVFAGQLSQQEINRYIAMIQDAVQRHWKVPTVSNVRDPLVEMVLNPDGSVNRVTILESSGNAAFDDSLIRAIHAAAPFEVPRREFELFRDNRMRFHALR